MSHDMTVRRHIYSQDDRLGRIEVHQHRSPSDELLAALEGQVLLLLPGPLLSNSKQKMERLQMRRQIRQEAPVEIYEAQVSLQLLLVLGLGRLEHSLNLAGCRGYACLGNDVAQVLNAGGQENALLQLELQPGILQSCQDFV
ncbi:uncharacterized protein LOC144169019 isoform X1 [Haemaphysalis longicornis]